MIRTLAATILLAFASPAFAQVSAPDRMSDADEVQVQQALNRGTLLYAYDQAAWHGSDDMLTKLDDTGKATIGGWVVDGKPENSEIVFYDKDEADPHAIYVAHFDWERLISSHLLGRNDDRTISPARKALIRARSAAFEALTKSGASRCVDKPFNTVVLPPEEPGGPMLVYFLTPQTDRTALPFGGHYLVPVAADGTAGPIRAFAKSCGQLEMGEGKDKAVGLVVTHILDPTPTEIHVFTMLAAKLPLYVTTTQNNRLWSIEFVSGRAQIRLVDPKGKR